MLLNSFFTITSSGTEGSNTLSHLLLNPAHAIFSGHFPGQPVVPGVCMLQMVKEVSEGISGSRLQLVQADFMKFLRVIDPNHQVQMQMNCAHTTENGLLHVVASITNDAVACFKFKGVFKFA